MSKRSLREALVHLPRMVVFAEVAARRSFRGAADALGLSPSTVTHHLQVLEEQVGVRLVERTSRAMTLTAAGSQLLVEARAALDAWDRGIEASRRYAEEPTGPLIVTAPDVLVHQFVIPVLASMLADHPRMHVELRVEASVVDLVAAGVDVAIRIGPLRDSSFGARLLARMRYGVFASPRFASAWPVRDPSDLDAAPWVHFSVRPESVVLRHAAGATHALRADVRARATTGAAVIALLEASAGFGLVPEGLVAREVAEGRLVDLLPGWSSWTADFYAVTPSARPADAKAICFLELLTERTAKLRPPRRR